MSLDWDGYVSHKNASEGWMRAKLPWTAMRLNNSQTALMKERAEGFAAKSESDTGKGAGSFKQKDRGKKNLKLMPELMYLLDMPRDLWYFVMVITFNLLCLRNLC
jgi:hypothetical protein